MSNERKDWIRDTALSVAERFWILYDDYESVPRNWTLEDTEQEQEIKDIEKEIVDLYVSLTSPC